MPIPLQTTPAPIPFQLTCRHMVQSPELAHHVEERAVRLRELSHHIIASHAIIELVGHHHRHGDRYRCSLNVAVPGHDIVVSHEPPQDRASGDAEASVDEAFDEVERQLIDWEKKGRIARRDVW